MLSYSILKESLIVKLYLLLCIYLYVYELNIHNIVLLAGKGNLSVCLADTFQFPQDSCLRFVVNSKGCDVRWQGVCVSFPGCLHIL